MAWNDPGRNRNPWGNRPDKGAADLDEALRNLQRKLSQIFGGNGGGGGDDGGRDGGRGSGPGGNAAMRGFGFGTVALVLLGVWALTGFYKVDAAERGIVTRFGQYVSTTEPGLRWHVPWPIEARQIINVETIEGVSDQTRMLTADENLVDINIAIQYRRAEPFAYAFNVRDPDQTLKEVAESAIREIVGRSRLDFVLEEGRQEITAKTKELIQRTLDSYKTGIEVTSVNLQGVSVPEQVQSSQRDAIKAREDRERLALEAQAYANDILPKAKGSAARQTEDAIAYRARIVADAQGEAARFTKLLAAYERAPGVTRQRLYYETIESVLGNTNKVLVDTKGTGNMLYLPLDKMMEGRARTLTLDEQRQIPATVQPKSEPAAAEEPAATVDARRERGGPLMNNKSYLPLLILGAAAMLLSMAAFTVRETELAMKLRFGEIVRYDYEPGLHFLTPFINNVIKFDRRILTEDYPAEQFLTSEGKILRINFFVKWRISDVSRFYQSTSGGSEEVANRRLGEIVKDGIKSVIARRTIQQVVAADRSEFLGEVLKIAGSNVNNLGITLVDVRVKSIELPEEVSESVFNRMRQDFARQATQLRAEGSAVSERTRAEADRQRTEILAEAYRQAEITRGEGDAAAADIYSEAFGRNAEFFAFYRSMQAFRRSLGKQGDVLVMAPEGEFFKYFNESGR